MSKPCYNCIEFKKVKIRSLYWDSFYAPRMGEVERLNHCKDNLVEIMALIDEIAEQHAVNKLFEDDESPQDSL